MSDRRWLEPEMLEVLHHRGPDMGGSHHASIAGKTIFIGHRRLNIIDLSDAGAQPMVAEHRRVVISYNGEVYNFRELKDRFLRGHHFRSRTDTEVLLHLYCELGPRFVEHLDGDFAIAILDEDAGRLLLYRDRLGVKPLYVYENAGTFAFASEIKSFVAADLPLTLSTEAVHQYLVFKYVPGQLTMHREVRRLSPGCMIIHDIATARTQLERYWTPAHNAALATTPYPELKDQLHTLLRDAVQSRLMGDVPVGNFFSGGLDSTIIAWFLKDRGDITHYCARKTENDLRNEGTTSDYYHARRAATQWGLDLVTIDIGSDEANPDQVREVVRFSDDLIADGAQIPSWLITRTATHTSRVMLSGMGADELFLGYAGHLLSLGASYLDRLPASWSRCAARSFEDIDQGRGSFKAYRRWLHKIGKYYGYGPLRYGLFSIVGDYESAASLCQSPSHDLLQPLRAYFSESDDHFEALTRFELDNFLVKNLHYFDRMCMANSVEGRVPYMDHRVVEFALSLHRSHKLTATGTAKKILRDTFRGRVPDHVLRRRKAGFGMPLRSILSDPAKVGQLIDLELLRSFDFLNVDEVPRLVERHRRGQEDQSQLIFALVSFQEWYRLHHMTAVAV